MSAALSGISLPHEDHSLFISIPTARISPGGASDIQSELNMMRSSQASVTRRSSLDDDEFDQFSEKDDLSEFDDLVEEEGDLQLEDSNQGNLEMAGSNDVNAEALQLPVNEDVIINREDGLLSEDGILSKKAERGISPPRGDGKRTVTFREDLLEPSAPTTTPLSTPRDSRELFSDSEEGRESRTLQQEQTMHQEVGEPSTELRELREQIKRDLKQTQDEIQSDLLEMNSTASH
ncbi:hypothetical protein BSL78_30257 [Apostichopus japonicus]|uniref:Uncharacterized protein n=1 Tax=Stichopus japonicus TaxID=307972 RepID=A0A2G8JB22_STIJA|nr:hypothetical protein BSL78_30257 [Apostichopus japonicus]